MFSTLIRSSPGSSPALSSPRPASPHPALPDQLELPGSPGGNTEEGMIEPIYAILVQLLSSCDAHTMFQSLELLWRDAEAH